MRPVAMPAWSASNHAGYMVVSTDAIAAVWDGRCLTRIAGSSAWPSNARKGDKDVSQ